MAKRKPVTTDVTESDCRGQLMLFVGQGLELVAAFRDAAKVWHNQLTSIQQAVDSISDSSTPAVDVDAKPLPPFDPSQPTL
jgi:hypothetical protein